MTSISDQSSPNSINRTHTVNRPIVHVVRIGGWLFRHRTSVPLPIALAVLFLPAADVRFPRILAALGVALTLGGEALRLWAVRHIGVISRTRSERLGPLVATGPFGLLRNPLYVGNIAIWTGFALAARLVWLAPLIALVLALEYHAIVRWEEQLLEARLGDAYREYASRVPRWIPTLGARGQMDARHDAESFSWHETIFSERGTVIAMAIGFMLLYLKSL